MYYSDPEVPKRILEILTQLQQSVATGQKKYFTLREVEALIGLKRTKVYNLRKMGALNTKQIGNKTYVSMDAINAYFNDDGNDHSSN